MSDVQPTGDELRGRALEMATRARQLQVEVDRLNDLERKSDADWSDIAAANRKIAHALQLGSIYANVAASAAIEHGARV